MVWEGDDEYPTLEDAFVALEAGLGERMEEVGID